LVDFPPRPGLGKRQEHQTNQPTDRSDKQTRLSHSEMPNQTTSVKNEWGRFAMGPGLGGLSAKTWQHGQPMEIKN